MNQLDEEDRVSVRLVIEVLRRAMELATDSVDRLVNSNYDMMSVLGETAFGEEEVVQRVLGRIARSDYLQEQWRLMRAQGADAPVTRQRLFIRGEPSTDSD